MSPALRAAVARDRSSVLDASTFELDLKGFTSISAIDLIIRATNGSTNNQAGYIHDEVDTIEVLDGSRVIFSLSGIQCRALNCYEMGHYPAVTFDEAANAVQQELFRVSFGRHLGDPLYWFDPAQYQNPVLRVTISMTISATIAFVTNTTVISAIVHTWDDRPSGRRGTFLTKEYKSFTSAASGDDRGRLPIDFPYRVIILRAFETAIAFDVDITQIKATLDTDRYVPFDMRAEQLRDHNAEIFGRFDIPYAIDRASDDVVVTHLAYPRSVNCVALESDQLCGPDARTINQYTLQNLEFSTPAVATETSGDIGM